MDNNKTTIEYLSVKEVAKLTGANLRTLKDRCLKGKYVCRFVYNLRGGNKGKQYEILISSLEVELQEKIWKHFYNSEANNGSQEQNSLGNMCVDSSVLSNDNIVKLTAYERGNTADNIDGELYLYKLNKSAPVSLLSSFHTPMVEGTQVAESSKTTLCNPSEKTEIVPIQASLKQRYLTVPEKAKNLALAKVDLLKHWESYRNNGCKKELDKQFVTAYNKKAISVRLFTIIGKISLASLYRWKKEYNETKDFYSLIPDYNYGNESIIKTQLSEAEQEEILTIMLAPSKFDIGNAYKIIKWNHEKNGQTIKSLSTYRRFIEKYKRNNSDKWTLMRDGEKALKDKVAPYIERDWSLIDVGDILVADGNVLDCQVINPFTGKPCRASFVTYMDAKSKYVAGYEIMLTENTQCITSALRNAIITLGRIPKMVQLDNGRAFKGKFFTGLEESGIVGIYEKLGIEVRFARAYNGRTKTVERFYKNFTSSFTKLMPSYIGNNIANKPAHMNRNEKFHKEIHNEYIPTIDELKVYLDKWLEFYNSWDCPNVEGKTIAEVFNEKRGNGVDINILDDLMMASEVRTIQRNGVTLFGNWYYSEELYSIKDKVVVKYSFADISSVRIYSLRGEFICQADATVLYSPHEDLFVGNDLYTYKKALKTQDRLIRQTIKECKPMANKFYDAVGFAQIEVNKNDNKTGREVKKINAKSVYTLPEFDIPTESQKKYRAF